MKSPDEIRQWAKDVGWPIALAALGVVVGALGMSLCHCDAFTPAIDPTPYPCHDPRMHWCVEGKTCCFDGFACVGGPGTTDPSGAPRCEYVGPSYAARLDAGGDD